MKKTTRNIIISLAVLLVLGAAAAVLILTNPSAVETEESSSSTSSESMDKIIDKEIADVESVAIENAESGETITLVPTKSSADSEENDTFTIEGWEDEKVLTSDALSLAQAFYSITPTKELGTVENLAEYGLDGDGAYKATVTGTDGSTETVVVGSEAGETYGWYILYNDTVYIAPLSTNLSMTKYDFIDTEVLSIPDLTSEDDEGNETTLAPEMESLRLSGTNYPQEIKLGLSDDELLLYEITEPIFAGVNSTRMDSLIEQLQNVTADGVAAVQATDEEIARYGLDEPSAVVEYELNNEKHTLRLGDETSGVYSLMADDDRTIYLIDSSSVDSWSNATLFDMRDAYIRLPNIKSIQYLTLESADSTEVYEVERTLDEERSTETSPHYDSTKVTLDGEEIDYETAYQPLYQLCLAVSVLNEDIREPEGEPILTVRYTYFDGGDEEICFYQDPDEERRCIATLNGVPSGIVRTSDVESILEAKPIVAAHEALEEEEE